MQLHSHYPLYAHYIYTCICTCINVHVYTCDMYIHACTCIVCKNVHCILYSSQHGIMKMCAVFDRTDLMTTFSSELWPWVLLRVTSLPVGEGGGSLGEIGQGLLAPSVLCSVSLTPSLTPLPQWYIHMQYNTYVYTCNYMYIHVHIICVCRDTDIALSPGSLSLLYAIHRTLWPLSVIYMYMQVKRLCV